MIITLTEKEKIVKIVFVFAVSFKFMLASKNALFFLHPTTHFGVLGSSS